MFDQLKTAIQKAIGKGDDELSPQELAAQKSAEEWTLLQTYVRKHPWSATRVISAKAGVRAKQAIIVLKARVACGELITIRGKGGSTLYALAGTPLPVESVSQVNEEAFPETANPASQETSKLITTEPEPAMGKHDAQEVIAPLPEPPTTAPDALPEPILDNSPSGKRVSVFGTDLDGLRSPARPLPAVSQVPAPRPEAQSEAPILTPNVIVAEPPAAPSTEQERVMRFLRNQGRVGVVIMVDKVFYRMMA